MKINWFEYKSGMTPLQFVENNEGHYANEWLENNPELWRVIDNWNLEVIYDDMSWENVMETMVECYQLYLEDNL
jgi:hypothetical protein